MNKTIFILLLIISIVLISILTYLIYDYLEYKKNVDIAFNLTLNQINKEIQKSNNNLKYQHKSIIKEFSNSKGSYNIHQYENSLGRYFNFGENQMDFNTVVTLENGLDIMTSNANELSICNNRDQCIRLSSDKQNFSIIPDNVGITTIYAENETPLAVFDMQNKGVFLGGTNETNSPLYVTNNEVFINQVNAKDISENLTYIETLR